MDASVLLAPGDPAMKTATGYLSPGNISAEVTVLAKALRFAFAQKTASSTNRSVLASVTATFEGRSLLGSLFQCSRALRHLYVGE